MKNAFLIGVPLSVSENLIGHENELASISLLSAELPKCPQVGTSMYANGCKDFCAMSRSQAVTHADHHGTQHT